MRGVKDYWGDHTGHPNMKIKILSYEPQLMTLEGVLLQMQDNPNLRWNIAADPDRWYVCVKNQSKNFFVININKKLLIININ